MQKENPNKYVMNINMYFREENKNDPGYYHHIMDPRKFYYLLNPFPKGSIITTEDQKTFTSKWDYNNYYSSVCYIPVNEQEEGIPIHEVLGIYIPEAVTPVVKTEETPHPMVQIMNIYMSILNSINGKYL